MKNLVHWFHDHTATFMEWVVGVFAGLKVFYEVFKFGRDWMKGRAETRLKINRLIDNYETHSTVMERLVESCERLETGQQANKIQLERLWVESRKNTEIQKILIDSSGGGYWITGSDGKTLEVSRKAKEITGYDEDDLKGLNWFNFVDDEDKQRVREDMLSAMTNKSDFRTHYKFKKPDGKFVNIGATAQIVIVDQVVHGWVGQIKEQ